MSHRELVIHESWLRSRQYGVDAEVLVEDILEPTQLRILKKENEWLLQVATPTVERLYGWVRSQHSTVIISHANGHILCSIGDPQFMNDAEKVHLREGAGWSEHSRGTNAIGTSIAVQEPVSVVGDEHFCAVNRFLYCAASPVFDISGELAAVIDVSGYCKEYHPSVVHLVDFVSRQVEDELLVRNTERAVILELRPDEDRTVRGLIAFNEDWQVIGANREGRRVLNLIEPTYPCEIPYHLRELKLIFHSVHGRAMDSKRIYLEASGREPQWWTVSVFLDNRPMKLPTGVTVREKQRKTHAARRMPSKELHYTFADIYCRDPALSATLEAARRVAETDYTVLITGESGTGKEMLSQAIHAASLRRHGSFVAINCGGIAPTLLHSELFGYEPGAFTGAGRSGRPGKFELAHGGTLFLDEVAEMPEDMQVALLRVLQEKVITRLGGTKSTPVDVRIIAATNRDLWEQVQQGRFREDLYFRLLGVELRLPALRERTDRVELAEHFLERIGDERGTSGLRLSSEAKRWVESYAFPGNVRELYAVLRQAAFFAEDGEIRLEHFPAHVVNQRKQELEPKESATRLPSLQQVEYAAILQALRTTEGNISRAARLLGIGRNTLYRRLRKLEGQQASAGLE
ncbi:sigma-54-dependent Fis family transcriptional regulator [Alicyclobacillus herbarius]|uniref:sigma-54-dependent Fis family transcriptional regulator n=1 Tax=Alicyclobacillus herbarius TaxID=122960 RepID=UPI0004152406|nr:sigma-54-dependent Fis family transcriptional regulator [Alicyclobacillus herbarius]